MNEQTEPRYPTTPMCDGTLLARFEPTTRDSDIFCATAAKCGQTWLLAVLHHLRTRGHDPEIGGRGLGAATPWLELPRTLTDEPFDRDRRLAQFEELGDPRLFKMHVIWEEIPRPAGSASKIITVTRDPRDLPWSMYSHLIGMRPGVRPTSAADDDFDSYFESWMEFGYYFKFVRSFWPHRDDPAVLWLRYEDMKRDLRQQAEKIVAWSGWDLTDADVDRALQWVTFEHMRENERSTIMKEAQHVWKDDANFFREGAVGKNRSRLSAAQEARIVARAREEFEPECFAWVMSQG